MDAQELDDAMIAAKKYAENLVEEFEESFYKDRTPPPKPTFDNFPEQINVLRSFIQQITGQGQGQEGQGPQAPPESVVGQSIGGV